jgi:hypothetical protein
MKILSYWGDEMKLREALEMAYECGLETVKEALVNASFCMVNFYPYEQIACEEEELFNEFEASGLKGDELVVDVLKK